MSPLSASHVLLVRSWMVDCCVSYNGHFFYKHQGQELAISSYPPPRKYKPREGCEKSLYMSEIRDERTISKSKHLINLFLVEPNTCEGGEPLPLIARQEPKDEILEKLIPKVPLPITMVLGESICDGDQATRATSLEYDEFKLSCDEFVDIFNELMRLSRATHCFDVLPKIFNNSYTFKKTGVRSTLGVFKPNGGKRRAKLTSQNFSPIKSLSSGGG